MRTSQRLWAPVLGVFLLLAGFGGRAAAQGTQDHTYSAQEIDTGSRLYANQCASCHGPNGDQVAGVNLQLGEFRRALSDDDIRAVITSGVPAGGMPPLNLHVQELDGLVAFIRAGFDPAGTAVRVGDAARGRLLFAGKGGCTACHRVNGEGARTAPDLSDIGAIRRPAAIQASLLDPTGTMWPINRPVRLVMRDGRVFRGRRLNEDTYTVQIIDEEERLLSLDKADIGEFELGTTSPMPSVAGILDADEIADLIAYLLSLRGL